MLFSVFFLLLFFENLGDDEEGKPEEPEDHPCPDFFETCCSVKSSTIVRNSPKSKPIGIPDKCGVRNKNGAIFEVNERDNEAQFGELLTPIKFLFFPFPIVIT